VLVFGTSVEDELGRRTLGTQMANEAGPRDAQIPALFLLVPATHLCALVGYAVLSGLQASQADSYNNPYTDWAAGFLLAAAALWFLGGCWSVIRARRQQRVPALVVVWLVLATLLVMGFIIQMMGVLSP